MTDDTTYYAIYDPSSSTSLQLATTLNDAEAADPAAAADVPALTWTDTTGTAQTTSIYGVEPSSSDQIIGSNNDAYTVIASSSTAETITIEDQTGYTSVPTVDELVTFEGQIGSSTTLQDNTVYTVESVSQITSTEFTVQLADNVDLATLGTLTTLSGVSPNYSYQVIDYDNVNNTVTLDYTGSATDTLTEGEQLTYTGADISGYLQNNSNYYVHILDQDASDSITIQLTASYTVVDTSPNTLTATAAEGSGVFTIDSNDPGTDTFIVSPTTAGTTLTAGTTTLTYSGPSISYTYGAYLQDGDSYTVSSVSEIDANDYQIELVTTAYQAAYASSPTAPATNLGLLEGSGITYDFTASDSGTGLLTVSLDSSSENTTVSVGTELTYDGTSGSADNTLQNGQTYQVGYVGSQSDTSDVTLGLITTSENVGYGLLTSSTGTFIIHEANATTGVLTVAAYESSAGLSDGDTVTFSGTSETGHLQNGETYSVIVVDGDDANNLTIQLAQYLIPTYGELTDGSNNVFTITDADTYADSLTLSETGSVALSQGESLTYTGASISGSELLQNGQSYTVNIIDQSDTTDIEVQLLDPSAATDYVVDATSDGIDPLSNSITLDDSSQTLIPNDTIVQYNAGSAENQIVGVTNGMYYETVVDSNYPDNVHLETAQVLVGTGQSYRINSIDGNDNISISILPGYTTTTITPGTTTFEFVGTSGDSSSLQNGVTYTVLSYNSTNGTIQLAASSNSTTALADSRLAASFQTVDLTTPETFTATIGGTTYTYNITGYNSYAATLTIDNSTDLTNGQAVTYSTSFDNSNPGLLEGATYYVYIPDASDPTTIQLTTTAYTGASGALLSTTSDSALTYDADVLDLQAAVDLTEVDTSYMSGADHTLTPYSASGVTVKATLESDDKPQAKSGIGSIPKLKDVLTKGELAPQVLNEGKSLVTGGNNVQKSIEEQGNGTSQYSISGSLVFEYITNTVYAEVGPDAVIQTSKNVYVASSLTEDNQTADDATVSKPKPSEAEQEDGTRDSYLNMAVALDLVFISNTSHAQIDGGARVDAGEKLDVDSEVMYPFVWQINNPEGFTVQNFFGTDGESNILSLFDGKLGLQDQLINNWANSGIKSSTTKASLSGSLDFEQYTNNNYAIIGAGALINQDSAYQTSAQTVSVIAETDFEAINFVGNTYIDLSLDNLLKLYRAGNFFGTVGANTVPGNQATNFGIGSSLLYETFTNNTVSQIGVLPSFDAGSKVDSSADTIDLGNNEHWATGQEVVYEDNGGTAISGLTSGQAYYVIDDSKDGNKIMLADTYADAIAGNALTISSGSGTQTIQAVNDESESFDAAQVNSSSNVITFTSSPGFTSGEAVVYSDDGGTAIDGNGSPLVNGQVYYVIVVGTDEVELASTFANAKAGTYMTLSAGSAGPDQSLTGLGTQVNYGNSALSSPLTFDAANLATTDSSTGIGIENEKTNHDSITFSSSPGISTGTPLIYNAEGNYPIGGLESGQLYYAIVDSSDPERLRLAYSLDDALAGTYIPLTTTGIGTQEFTSPALNIFADQSMFDMNLATSGGAGVSGAQLGVNGTFDYFDDTSTTEAQAAPGTDVTSNSGTTGDVNVSSGDNSTIVGFAWSRISAKNIAVGLSGLYNDINRNTYAVIGSDGSQGTSPFGSNWDVGGGLAVSAKEYGVILNVAVDFATSAPRSRQARLQRGHADADVRRLWHRRVRRRLRRSDDRQNRRLHRRPRLLHRRRRRERHGRRRHHHDQSRRRLGRSGQYRQEHQQQQLRSDRFVRHDPGWRARRMPTWTTPTSPSAASAWRRRATTISAH